MDLRFPFKGYHRGFGTEKQPEGTTPYIQNMRVKGESGRFMGEQRGGLQKAYTQQIGGIAAPIVAMIEITIVD